MAKIRTMDEAKIRSVIEAVSNRRRRENSATLTEHIVWALHRRGVMASKRNIKIISRRFLDRKIRKLTFNRVSKDRQTIAFMLARSKIRVINTHRRAKTRLSVVREIKSKKR